MCVFLSRDSSIPPPLFFFFNVFIRSFFVVPFDRDADRGSGRIALFVLIARTSCVPVLLSMYLFGHVGFILYTYRYIYILKYINEYVCVCIRDYVVLDDGSITPMGRPFAHRNGSGEEEKRTG